MGAYGWRLLNSQDGLWVQILRKKFKVGELQDQTWLVVKGTWSPTWRSLILGIREVLLPGAGWVLGDGRKISFWKDKWLSNEPIFESRIVEIPMEMLEAKVRDLWQNGTGWLTQTLEPYLSLEMRLRLATMVVDDTTGARDRISWSESEDGTFSVKSAYHFLTKDDIPRPNMEALYKKIWSLKAPERVRVFLWLVSRQVIMTNLERKRRHLSENGMCQLCRNDDESILHVLRDCSAAAGLWVKMVPPNKRQRFFSLPLLEWLYENLSNRSSSNEDRWAILFALTVWWCWKWRCGYVFGEIGKCRDRVQFVKDKAREVILANKNLSENSAVGIRVEKQISWLRPATSWCKLNTDGASRGNPGLATAGGVLRDEYGEWRGGFAGNIGICSATLAELWGVYYGLCIAWECGIRRLEVEVDSATVVDFLKTGIQDSHPLSFLVRLCYGFISRDWIVKFSHVYREANRLADGLATYAFSLPFGLHYFETVPEFVAPIVLEDLGGVSRPRRVCL